MFGYIKSFEIEKDGQHVLLTCYDPGEGEQVVIRTDKAALSVVCDAEPLVGVPGLVQTPTDFGQEVLS